MPLQTQDVFCDLSEADLIRLPKAFRKHVVTSSPFDRFCRCIGGRKEILAAIKTDSRIEKLGPLKGWHVCRCVALKGIPMKRVRCAIYQSRPETCRTTVVPGDRTCLRLRRYVKEQL